MSCSQTDLPRSISKCRIFQITLAHVQINAKTRYKAKCKRGRFLFAHRLFSSRLLLTFPLSSFHPSDPLLVLFSTSLCCLSHSLTVSLHLSVSRFAFILSNIHESALRLVFSRYFPYILPIFSSLIQSYLPILEATCLSWVESFVRFLENRFSFDLSAGKMPITVNFSSSR